MGDPITTSVLVSAGVGSALYGARESHKARREARTAADQEKERAKKAADEQERLRKEAEQKKGQAVMRGIAANRMRDVTPYTRSGTIATSPLGSTGTNFEGKRLLGS